MLAPDVHPRKQRRTAVRQSRPRPHLLPVLSVLFVLSVPFPPPIFTPRNQVIGEERPIIIPRHAHKLLQPRLLIRALMAQALQKIVILPRQPVIPWIRLAPFRLQLPQKPVLDRVRDRHPVQAETLRIPLVPRFVHQLVEKVRAAAMRRNNIQPAAPQSARIPHRVEQPVVGIERKFVKHTMPPLPRLRVRIRRQTVNGPPAVQRKHMRRNLPRRIQHLTGEGRDRPVQQPGPLRAIVAQKPRLQVVARRHPGVVRLLLASNFFHQVKSHAKRNPDLPRLLHQPPPRPVLNPLRLIRQKVVFRAETAPFRTGARNKFGTALAPALWADALDNRAQRNSARAKNRIRPSTRTCRRSATFRATLRVRLPFPLRSHPMGGERARVR